MCPSAGAAVGSYAGNGNGLRRAVTSPLSRKVAAPQILTYSDEEKIEKLHVPPWSFQGEKLANLKILFFVQAWDRFGLGAIRAATSGLVSHQNSAIMRTFADVRN